MVLWFVAGVVFEIISGAVLFPIWDEHCLMPIGRRLQSLGGNTLVRPWVIFGLHFIDWSIAILAGVIGGLLIKRHVLRDLCSLGIGFAILPLLLYAYDTFGIPGLHFTTQRGFLVLLIVCCGLLTHHLKNGIARKSPAVPKPTAED
jgi:hypothetical protein